ncbi:MAG: Na+/H+ antiporter subunit E [Bdellovibrionales bacterium]|nr:Na+/H+ antiporter subunit E [Bdellovibrionales bacterium]
MALACTLFLFWMVLSQKFDFFHLGMGLLSSILVSMYTRKIFAHSPYKKVHAFSIKHLSLLFLYFPWLLIEIIKANIQVAIAVLKPNMDLQLQTFTIKTKLPKGLPRLIFANSITLTPGTVTLDLQGDELLVHALNNQSAQGLQKGSGNIEMEEKILRHFVGEEK